ncbi:hypothetical protein [Paenibacillus lemnae]|uniref:Uncharacterized protein n=1 Tax=Paenibacillus lemnae TaxID=1330551 RepID=A0A848M274_PAELE|nr:hypothetical protein [Paenibacillus lemnae]NMO94340.1 hypothetical protein [Paenibacillus lemnae]
MDKGWHLCYECGDSLVTELLVRQAGSSSDFLMFTGHGSENGDLALYDYGLHQPCCPFQVKVNWDSVGDSWYCVKFAMFLACLVLNKAEWGSILGNGMHHILGYTGDSHEPLDALVVEMFLSRCYGEVGKEAVFAPRTVLDAWRYANILADENQWAVIGHNGNGKDYLFGVKGGPTPDVRGTGDIKRWRMGSAQSIFLKDTKAVTSSSASAAGRIGRIRGIRRIPEAYRCWSGRTFGNANLIPLEYGAVIYERDSCGLPYRGNPAEAIEEAENFIQRFGGLPEDAGIRHMLPIFAESLVHSGREIIAYLIVYKQVFNGIEVDGLAGSSIKVLVDNHGVVFFYRYWHELLAEVEGSEDDIMTTVEAINQFNRLHQFRFKTAEAPSVKKAELVYWSAPHWLPTDECVPAWRMHTEAGGVLFMDAHSGEYLNERKVTST